MSRTPSELKSTIVQAGAGAGKTRGLVEQVVAVYREFKLQGKTPRIILTTFTRKATQELKERLTLKACEEQDVELLSFVSSPSLLHISTIHGVLSLFLRKIGPVSGLDAGFQILDDAEVKRMNRVALRDVLLSDPKFEVWMTRYNFDRLLEMVSEFYSQWIAEESLVPATREDLERVARQYGTGWKNNVSTWVAQIERDTAHLEAAARGKWQDFAVQLAAAVSTWSDDLPGLLELPRKPNRSPKNPELDDLHATLQDGLEKLREFLKWPSLDSKSWDRWLNEWREFAQLSVAFAQRLKRDKDATGRYSLEDLELLALRLVRENPLLSQIFGEDWDYWMVDEFQDTSPIQVEILKALQGYKEAHERPRYLVGDPQQSIYLFRGAEVEVFAEAQKEIVADGGEKKFLGKNYRSHQDVLSWINGLTSAFGEGFVQMQHRDPSDQDQAWPHDPRIWLHQAQDAMNESQAIATRVGELVTNGARLEDIGILARTKAQLNECAKVLRLLGYPTHIHAAGGFAGRREVMDATALWRFLIHPHDNLNLLILLRSPWFSVADGQLAEWMESRPNPLWKKLVKLEPRPEPIARLCEALELAQHKGLSFSFESTLCRSGILDLCLRDDATGRKESNLWKLIQRARENERRPGLSLIDWVEAGEEDPLESFDGDATSAQEPNAINLMTIHGSKGLQFKHVLMPGLGDSPQMSDRRSFSAEKGRFYFPIWDEQEREFQSSLLDHAWLEQHRQKEMKEFDRHLYVAVTRAKETLSLTWSAEKSKSWVQRHAFLKSDKHRHQPESPLTPTAYTSEATVRQVTRSIYHSQLHESVRQSVTAVVDQTHQVRLGADRRIKRWQAQVRGQGLHKQLEALHYSGTKVSGKTNDPILLFLKREGVLDLIQNGYVEWGFQVQTKVGVIEGQIDLWAKTSNGIVIADYKSGSPEFEDKAIAQLELYAWALRRFGHQEPIELMVVYPLIEKVVRKAATEDLLAAIEVKFSGT